jgi:hypothetical protein
MSLIVTIRDKNNFLLLYGTVYETLVKSNGDIIFVLTKIHAPYLHEEEYTYDGFKIPSECRNSDICKEPSCTKTDGT